MTYHDVIGTTPFSSATVPLTTVFLFPQSCPFCSFLLGWLLSLKKALFSAGRTVPLGKGWAGRSCSLQQVASRLTCQAGSSTGLSCVVSAWPPSCGGMAGGLPGRLPGYSGQAGNPVSPGHQIHALVHKGGFLVVTKWWRNT